MTTLPLSIHESGDQAEAGLPSLDPGAKLVDEGGNASKQAGKWCTRAWPKCAEASLYVLPRRPRRPPKRVRVIPFLGPVGENVRVRIHDRTIASKPESRWRMTLEPEPSEEQAAESLRTAGRRAQAKVRRYASGNGLSRLGTLTFAPEHLPPDRAAAMVEGAAFVRRLRHHLGHPIPYVVVVERGTKGTKRLHLHFAFGMYIPVKVLEAVWGKGWVYMQNLGAPGEDVRKVAGRVARYVAKYVEKSFVEVEAERRRGEHRYEVAQGFQPQAVDVHDQADEEDALSTAVLLVGEGMPTYVWSSATIENWPGPPVRILRW